MLVVSGSVRTEQPNEIFFDNLEIIPEADIALLLQHIRIIEGKLPCKYMPVVQPWRCKFTTCNLSITISEVIHSSGGELSDDGKTKVTMLACCALLIINENLTFPLLLTSLSELPYTPCYRYQISDVLFTADSWALRYGLTAISFALEVLTNTTCHTRRSWKKLLRSN